MQLAHTAHPGPPGADTVVLLGSLGSDRGMWDPQIPALAAVATVLAVDVRGHGGSPAPAGPYRIAELANDVLELLEARRLERVHLVGLSLGGAITQQIAIEHPGRVHTVSLLCTAARFGDPAAWADRAAAVRRDGVASIARSVVGRWFTETFAADHPEVVARCVAMVTATDDEGYASCCEALARWDSGAFLDRITAPALVIAGAHDPATTPAELRVIADRVPRARLHVVTPGAHLASIEQAGRVTALIRDHLTAPIDGTPS